MKKIKEFFTESSENEIRNKITIIAFLLSIMVICIHTYNLEVYGIGADGAGIAGLAYKIETYWS